MSTGRIDVHAHLIPGIDDGCATIQESIQCARRLVAAGYTHCFCTPHFWDGLPENTVANVARHVVDLQRVLDGFEIKLHVMAGAEISLRAGLSELPPEEIPSYGMARKYCLIDLWADRLPSFFEPEIRWLQSMGMTVILAHPERMEAVQSNPGLADYFAKLGLLLQGNLHCLTEPTGSPNRVTAEWYLLGNRYFMLGTDLHNSRTLSGRINGLARATELVGQAKVDELTIEHPRTLLHE